jgi:hypothetical protein
MDRKNAAIRLNRRAGPPIMKAPTMNPMFIVIHYSTKPIVMGAGVFIGGNP